MASYFMEIKSLLTLPKDKRSKASAKELLKALEEAEEQLEYFTTSPYSSGYVAIATQIESFNGQLQERAIDIFDPSQKAVFEMGHKYSTEIMPYYDRLEEFRKRMTPVELLDAQKEVTSQVDSVRKKLLAEQKEKVNGSSN